MNIRSSLSLAFTLVFLSGFTGLVYQVTWQKYLSVYLGSHASATAVILCVFFLFLSLGYQVIGRVATKILKNQFLLYGLLEAVIGFYCLISPSIFESLFQLFQGAFVGVPYGSFPDLLLNLLFASLFIGVPTFLMGGTIPVLTQALTQKFEVSHQIHAWVYGVNTLGAFVGTLAADFVFLEKWGLPLTLIMTSFLNLAIGFVAYVYTKANPSRLRGLESREETKTQSGRKSLSRQTTWALLAVSFISGFYVFSLETILIRLAGLTAGSSAYTYSIIVSAFILAIALGSFFVSRRKEIVGFRFFSVIQILLFSSTVALYLSVHNWPEWFLRIRFLVQPSLMNFNVYWFLILGFFLLVLLIPVGLMGMNLPLLFNYLRARNEALTRVVGRVYSVNCLGSALGATIGGYWLFQYLDAHWVFRINLFLIVLTIPIVAVIYLKNAARKWVWTGALGLCFVVVLLPAWKSHDFTPGMFTRLGAPPQLAKLSDYMKSARANPENHIFHRFDPNTVVVVSESPVGTGTKPRTLFVNAKADASTSGDALTRSLTGLIPLSLADKIEKVFISGLGAGLSLAITTGFPENKTVKVAEISEGVIQALPFFDEFNKGLVKSRSDKYSLHVGDAYKVLKKSTEQYDVILTEPSNPWVMGVEKLFTREFLETVRGRLTPKGVYGQWFPLFQMDQEAFTAVLNTFASVFPWTTIWSGGGGALIFVGANERPQMTPEKLMARMKSNPDWYAQLGFKQAPSILGNQLLADKTVRRIVEKTGGLHTLEFPILNYRAGRAAFAGLSVNWDQFLMEHMRVAVDLKDPDQGFLYDAFLDRLSPEFFEESFKFFTQMNPRNPSQLRLNYWNLKKYPNRQKEKFASDVLLTQRILIEGSRESLGMGTMDPKRQDAKIQELVSAFRSYRVMHLPVKIEALARQLPEKCSSPVCFDTKKRVLETALPERKLPETQSEIETFFRATFGG